MNAVVTVSIGESNEIGELTHPSIKAYAKKIGAEFVVIDRPFLNLSPHWSKFHMHSLLKKYNRIIYVDTDLIIRSDCPNLFKIVPKRHIGLFDEAPYVGGRVMEMDRAISGSGVQVKKWDGKYFNTGVMVISSRHKKLFAPIPEQITSGMIEFWDNDQSLLNARIATGDYIVHDLHFNYNRMTCMEGTDGFPRHSAHIIHYAGCPNQAVMKQLITNDLKQWKEDSPKYNYDREIWFEITGGIGDQICAEPSIRYYLEHMSEGTNLTITTHWPDLFEHLSDDLNVLFHGGSWNKDVQPINRKSLPEPNEMFQFYLSNMLCHPVDFSSISLLRRTLTAQDRTPMLKVKKESIDEIVEIIGDKNIEEMILVHAGKHWPSKTFPIKWWQDVVDGINDEGITVCLIGKNDDGRGVLPLELKGEMISTVDKISLQGLIALISKAKTTLSNDSSPIHIAGAFENNIILIPSCKHPEHILPYRHGDLFWKAAALYKKLTIDDVVQVPWADKTEAADFEGDWNDYLPNVKDVVETVKKMHFNN